jgi:hypothetical protein
MNSLICILLVFCVATPFITPSFSIDVFDELLWSTDGDDIYVQCIELHESTIAFSIDKSLIDST